MFGIGTKNLPHKNKFSYATAQEYSELVRQSIGRQRSKSKDGQRINQMVSPGRLRPTSPREEYRPIRRLQLKQKISERSRSKSQQDNISSYKGSNQQVPTSIELQSQSKVSSIKCRPNILPRKTTSYEQEHLLSTLQKQNTELLSQIESAQSKISKLSSNIQQQRRSHFIEKQFYEQQLSRLRQNLELQIMSRQVDKMSQEQQCSLEDQLLLTMSENSSNEFLDMKI